MSAVTVSLGRYWRFETQMRRGGDVLIPTQECWELLKGASIGHVTLPVPSVPGIVPVRYYVGEDAVIICMGDYEIAPDELTDLVATFAADVIDPERLIGWSVQVHGVVQMSTSTGAVTDCSGISAGQVLRLSPLSVVGYQIGLCPFASAFDDLVVRFGTAEGAVPLAADGREPHHHATEVTRPYGRRALSGTSSTEATDVLIVEFQDALRETTADILRRAGASVVEAESAETAERILHSGDVKLILLEPDLPFGGAADLLECGADIPPVVVFSSQPFDPEDQLRMGGKVAGFLQKPVSPLELIEVVRALLGTSEG